MTAILLSKLSLKEKELLMLIFLIGSKSNELSEYIELSARLTLDDIENLEIAFRASASKVLKRLISVNAITWDKSNHKILINILNYICFFN